MKLGTHRWLGAIVLFAAAGLVACGDDDDDDDAIGEDSAGDDAESEDDESEEPGAEDEDGADDGDEASGDDDEDLPDEEELTEGLYTLDDCPLTDQPEFCAFAVEVANAVAAGEFDSVVQLTSESEINCDDVAIESFPECSPGETRSGYLVTSAQGVTRFLTVDEYRAIVEEAIAPLETEGEELGPGVATVISVGTRGDSHDLLASSQGRIDGEPADLVVILTIDQEEEGFRISGFAVDTVEGFADAGFADPFSDASADIQPWGVGE